MQTSALKALWTECFGNQDGWIDDFFQTAFHPEQVCSLTREGRLAAGLTWMEIRCGGQKLAYLYAVATHPDFRRQGLCRELMTQIHGTLAQRGYAGALLVPGNEPLRQMYRNMGYENVGGIRKLTAQASQPVPVREVTPAEYAVLRRTLLPPGGAVQEAGAIEYLAVGGSLYAGDGFLLAARPKDGELFGLELLGDDRCAGGILGALGFQKGVFRVPGDEPFAMACPLSRDFRAPTYFGLAFE